MKNVKNDLRKFFMSLIFLLMALGISGCSDDDDAGVTPEPDPATGSISAEDQILSGNSLIIGNVTVGQDSWLVARNESGENDPEIVSEAVFLEEGSHNDVELPLTEDANLTGNTDGDDFVLMLHTDDQGAGAGTFNYDGSNGADDLITNDTGAAISVAVNATAPGFSIDDDQIVNESNEVIFNFVNTAADGWITIYGANEDGTVNEEDLVAQQYVEAGVYEDYAVAFNDGFVAEPGAIFYPRLHLDDPADQTFTYTTDDGTEDLREIYGFDTTTGEGMFTQNTATTSTPGSFTVGVD